jgi:hypothetical protein
VQGTVRTSISGAEGRNFSVSFYRIIDKRRSIPLAIAVAPISWSTTIFDASIDTSALVGSGPFSIDFQFIDGTGLPGDLNNNSVSISHFTFGAGGRDRLAHDTGGRIA